jgi:sortase B
MELKSLYPNVVGYISIPSLSINYPVVRTDNNDYYLNHLITGEESATGSIFLDYRCGKNPLSARNSVIYGHNMNNGAMFHNLEMLFTLENFLDATVEYVCEEGIFFYKPLSVYRADATYPFARFSFADNKAYETFCRTAAAKSQFTESENVICAYDSNVITLVTCTNSLSSKTGRYVYQAVLDTVYLVEAE